MSLLSILIAILLLGMLVSVGIIMVVVSLRGLRAYWVTNPSFVPGGDYAPKKRWVLPLNMVLLTLGLFLAFWGAFGTYNLIWAA